MCWALGRIGALGAGQVLGWSVEPSPLSPGSGWAGPGAPGLGEGVLHMATLPLGRETDLRDGMGVTVQVDVQGPRWRDTSQAESRGRGRAGH